MSNLPSLFGNRENMVSGPSQMSSFGSSTFNHAPFGFSGVSGSSAGGGGLGQKTTSGAGGGFFGVSGRSLTPNPSVNSSLANAAAQYQNYFQPQGPNSQLSPGSGSAANTRNLFPSLINGIGSAGAQGLLSGSSSVANYFSPSSNSFPYGGAPGRGQPGSGAASSLSSMFSSVSGKDIRGSYENDFLMQMHQLPSSGGAKGASVAAVSASAIGGVSANSSSSLSRFAPGQVTNSQVNVTIKPPVNENASSLTSTNPLGFHDNEFPSLTSNRSNFSGGLGRNVGGRANLIRQPETRNEFQIHNEDFPALPGSQEPKHGNLPSGGGDSGKDGRFPGDRLVPQKRDIYIDPDGNVTGIPASMLNDQFGMVGLLACLRAIETDPAIIPLALGHDLTTLGLNLNATEKNLYQYFGGPWADTPCRPQDIDYHVPPEYLTNAEIGSKLAPVKLNRYTDDLLFYLFYNFGGEMFQLAAAAELYNRDWRYHKEEKCWLTRASGQGVVERTPTHERGTYYVFDATHWRKVPKDMTLEYDKLEDRPMLPPQQPVVAQPSHNS